VTQTANPRSDDIEYLLTQRDAAFRYAGSALATRSNARAADKTVVEYFNRDAGRYFITGPASEQATLNALLALFRRKAANIAMCRSSPYAVFTLRLKAAGATRIPTAQAMMSALNTLRQVGFEGFDFAPSSQPTQPARRL